MTAPIPELTDRARDVFRIVVESYIGLGLPVGAIPDAGATRRDQNPAAPVAKATMSVRLKERSTSNGAMPSLFFVAAGASLYSRASSDVIC